MTPDSHLLLPSPGARNILGRRLLLTFSAVLLLTLAGSGIGIRSLAKVDEATRETIQQRGVSERLVADAYRLQAINAERYKAMALSSEPEVGEILSADIRATAAEYDDLIRQLDQRLHDESDRALLAQAGLDQAARPAAARRVRPRIARSGRT